MAHPVYPVGQGGSRPLQMPTVLTRPIAGSHMHQGLVKMTGSQGQAMQPTRSAQTFQPRPHGQYLSVPNAQTIPRGLLATADGDAMAQMYNVQVSLSTQLQTAQCRLRQTQTQLETAQSEVCRNMLAMQAMQARIHELEMALRRKPDVGETYGKGSNTDAMRLVQSGERHPCSVRSAEETSGSEAGSRPCGDGMSSSSSESSLSSIGTPGPTLMDDQSVVSSNDAKQGHASFATFAPRASMQQFAGVCDDTRSASRSSVPLSRDSTGNTRASLLGKGTCETAHSGDTMTRSVMFRNRLSELFQMTASFSQTYTNKPDSLTGDTADVKAIMDLTLTASPAIIDSLMSKHDTRCGLVARIMNQFMTRRVLFYEVVRGFNSTADSEIRQFLELLYSDTPGLVRSLFYTHLANQVLGLRSQPCFSAQFQTRQSVNANSLFSIISPFVLHSPSSAAQSTNQSMRSDFLSIIQTAHALGVDMISGAYEFNPFWPSVGDQFDPAWMVNRDAGIIGHKIEARKEGTVSLATSPGIWFSDYTKDNGDRSPEMLVSANVLLQKNEERRLACQRLLPADASCNSLLLLSP